MNIQISFAESQWVTQLKNFFKTYITGATGKRKLLIVGQSKSGRISFGRIFRQSSVSLDPIIDEVVIGQELFDLHHLETLKDVHVWEHSDVEGVIYFLNSSDVPTIGEVRENLEELVKILSKSPQVPILILDSVQENRSSLSKEVLIEELRIGDRVLSEVSSLVNLSENAIGLFQVDITSLEGVEEARTWLGSHIG